MTAVIDLDAYFQRIGYTGDRRAIAGRRSTRCARFMFVSQRRLRLRT